MHLYFIGEGYSLVTSNGFCKHVNGGWCPACYDSPFPLRDFVKERSSCQSYCTIETSCVGYAYQNVTCFNNKICNNCYLYQTDNSSCPNRDDWSFDIGTVEFGDSIFSPNDLVEHVNDRGWVCYRKNKV